MNVRPVSAIEAVHVPKQWNGRIVIGLAKTRCRFLILTGSSCSAEETLELQL
jgi:hypothetical protein